MPSNDHKLKKIAELAYLAIDEDSAAQLDKDVNSIMDYVAQLQQVNTNGVAPLLHPLDLHQRLRDDIVTQTSCVEELASLSANFDNNVYLVPQVLEAGK